MITLKRQILEAIIAHAKNDLPDEACGYLAGNDRLVSLHYPLTNIDHSPEHFSFDPKEQFSTVRDARSKGLQILANYHSHPSTPSRPSVEDIKLAYDPGLSYLIVSLAEEIPVVRSFLIRDGLVENEELIIED